MEVLADVFWWERMLREYLRTIALGEQGSRLGSARDLEFLKDGVQVTLHRGCAQAEGRRNLFVSSSFGDQGQDSLFLKG